ERANFLLSLFYAGPGIGILASGLVAPFVLQGFGPGSWWIVWWAMTGLAVVMTIPVLLVPLHADTATAEAAPAKFAIAPMLVYLAGYFLFGAGYIAYMTFMIAYVPDAGGVAFFAVVGSTTAFVRFNYPPQAWPTAIAAMTISFGIGQTLGPIAVGAITDALGSLSFALNVSAAMLALGAVLSAFQRRVGRK